MTTLEYEERAYVARCGCGAIADSGTCASLDGVRLAVIRIALLHGGGVETMPLSELGWRTSAGTTAHAGRCPRRSQPVEHG